MSDTLNTPFNYAVVQYMDIGTGESGPHCVKGLVSFCETYEEADGLMKSHNKPAGWVIEKVVNVVTETISEELRWGKK